MIHELFSILTRAVEGTAAIALAASFAWGILSVLLSPCHLASIPLVVGFINGQGQITTRRAFYISSLFSVGILITIAGIGAITAAVGRMLGDVGPYGNYFVAAIFFVVGLILLDETKGYACGVYSGAGFWHCHRPMYICIYGPCTGSYVQSCLIKHNLRRYFAAGIWLGALFGDCFCRNLHRACAEIYELE